MIDHTGLKVSDPVASRRFYEAALAAHGHNVEAVFHGKA
jgi:catechol 2,3-dioxygenase-like lactoylglutathione lyase family enzyme